MADALRLRAVSVQRGGRRVVAPLDLTARFGEVMAILGPNGAGKTTLLKAIAGLIPHEGEILLGSTPMASLSIEERARRLAFVPQQSLLRAPLPVREVVAQGRHAHRGGLGRLRPRDTAAIDAALATADIVALADRPFTELSFGEQRRVLLARGLATGAPLLLLDEPTASLDLRHALDLYGLLRRLASEDRAVLVVLHQLDDAIQHTDQALLMADGRALAQGKTRDVITPAAVEDVYAVRMQPKAGLRFQVPES